MNEREIGGGAYGKVYVRSNMAVKKFEKTSHLIQEWLAGFYLRNSSHIVNMYSCSLQSKEIIMELYGNSLRGYLRNGISLEDKYKILSDICYGICQIHDKGLVHGDIKPSNILVNSNPLKCVIGDLGFVSLKKYSKIRRTTEMYRDPIINYSYSHDIYSLGVIFLDLFGIRPDRKIQGNEMINACETISEPKIKKLAKTIFTSSADKRPGIRDIISYLGFTPPVYTKRYACKSEDDHNNKDIYNFVRKNASEYHINKWRRAFVLYDYIDNKIKIKSKYTHLYLSCILTILSSVFSNGRFNFKIMRKVCNEKYKYEQFIDILTTMLNDEEFARILFCV